MSRLVVDPVPTPSRTGYQTVVSGSQTHPSGSGWGPAAEAADRFGSARCSSAARPAGGATGRPQGLSSRRTFLWEVIPATILQRPQLGSLLFSPHPRTSLTVARRGTSVTWTGPPGRALGSNLFSLFLYPLWAVADSCSSCPEIPQSVLMTSRTW